LSIKKWQVMSFDRIQAAKLAAEVGVPPLLGVLLQTRGVTDPGQARTMLSPGAEFSDPFLLPDMQKAVERIGCALDSFEKIAVYGDYDADGVTATAMMYSYLESCGGNVIFYIPDREAEGYGLNMDAVKALHDEGVTLILTVDNGISSVAEVDYAASLGIDTVITDHHRPKSELPKAVAVVDPWREDCACPYRDYSGAGVAFKLLMALEGPELGAEALLDNYADLVAIGTIGDVVPLTGENRLLVSAGLNALSNGDRPGLEALLELCGMDQRPLKAMDVAYTIVPRINATGRMGAADRAVRLLTADSLEEAENLAAEICSDNASRRKIETEVLQEAMNCFRENPSLLYDRVLVVWGENWHHGVIGIVAAKITERFGKPCIVLSCNGKDAKGSGRSVEGFSLFDAVCSCGDLLTKYGGHPMAAGMSLPVSNLEEFRKRINRYAASLPGPMPVPLLRIDCVLKPEKLSVEIPQSLQALEPFGTGNPFPLFGLFGVVITDITPVGGGKHLRLTVKKGNISVSCMRFGVTLEQFAFRVGDTVDLAVDLEARPYEGRMTLSVIVRDIRLTGMDEEALVSGRALYEKALRGEPLSPEETAELLPTREVFSTVYRALRDNGGFCGEPEYFFSRLSGAGGFAAFLTALAVFRDRGLIEENQESNTYRVRVVRTSGKVNLEESPLLVSLHSAGKAGEQ
jgi:single-stranded-DNA-specific exonuclease